jgi:hypothetical protein
MASKKKIGLMRIIIPNAKDAIALRILIVEIMSKGLSYM